MVLKLYVERSAFWTRVEERGERDCLIGPKGTVSGARLAAMADAWAAQVRMSLPEQIARPLVAIEAVATDEGIAAYLGCLRAGWPVIMIEAGSVARTGPVVANYRPNIVVRWDGAAVRTEAGDPEPCTMDPALALLLSTSGTTGATKLVRLSQGNLASNADAIAEYLGLGVDEVAVLALPLHYSYGLSVLHSHLAAGAAVALAPGSVVDPWFWDFARKAGGTSVALVPAQFEMLAGTGFSKSDLPGLRTLTQAGGRLDPDLVRGFAARGAGEGWRLVLMYGQTEAGPRISYVPPEDVLEAADTIGRAIPGGRLRIEDESGNEITVVGVAGELVYEGPNVMMGYALSRNDLALPAGPPVLRTGDIAERTASGYFRIVGRASRFVKLFGLRIGLDEIETTLRAEGRAVRLSGTDRGVVIFATGPELAVPAAQRELRDRVADRYGLPPRLVRVAPLDAIPLMSSGKVDYRNLAAKAEVLLDGPGDGEADPDLLAAVAQILRRPALDPATSFRAAGGDSLAHLETELLLTGRLGPLPAGWQDMPLGSVLAGRGRTEGVLSAAPPLLTPRVVPVDPMRLGVEVPLRLLAILAVVALHATQWPIAGGAFLLTVLAGLSLARYQSKRLLEGDVLSAAATMLVPVLSAYFAVLVPLAVYFPVDARWFTLVANLSIIGGERPEPRFFLPYWYVSTYAQAVLLFCLPFAVPGLRRAVRARPFAAALAGCGVVAAGLALSPVESLGHGLQLRHPLGALQLVTVGWLICMADTWTRRAIASAVVVASWALLWRDADPAVVVALVPGALCLLWIPPIPVPLRVGRWMVRAAALTLHIYVAHVPALYVARHVLDAPVPILAVTLVLSVTVAVILRAGLRLASDTVLGLVRRRGAVFSSGGRSVP